MMFPFLLPVAGALGGAILKKKDPLTGAALGGGLGLLGAAAIPGAAAAAPAAAATQAAAPAAQAAPQGLLGTVMGAADKYGKPAGQALQMAQVAQGMFGQEPQAPAPAQPLVAQGDPIGQMLAQQQQMEEMRRRNRGLLGGGYGGLA
jgi:hypothetical protein